MPSVTRPPRRYISRTVASGFSGAGTVLPGDDTSARIKLSKRRERTVTRLANSLWRPLHPAALTQAPPGGIVLGGFVRTRGIAQAPRPLGGDRLPPLGVRAGP